MHLPQGLSKMALNLVPLPEVERLSPLCIRILGGNPSKFALQGTNTYLLGRGPKRILIDTGEGKPSWIAALKRTCAEEDATITSALISHWHPDHVGGIKDLLGWSPQTSIFKNAPEAGQEGIEDGQVFSLSWDDSDNKVSSSLTLTAHHTPGHTTDHMVFLLAQENALFTADNVLGQGTAVFEDLATYLQSLDKMRRLPPFTGRAYPGHGPVIEDGRARIAEYIAHRQQREDQIVQTLQSNSNSSDSSETPEVSVGRKAWEPMELVKVIYRDVPESLHLPALGGLMQVLQKLEKEGRARREDGSGKWVLTDRPSL